MPYPRSSARPPSKRVLREKPKSLSTIAKELEFCRSTRSLRTWILDGRSNPFTGKLVYLEYAILPEGTATSQAAIDRFLAGLNKTPTRKSMKKKKT